VNALPPVTATSSVDSICPGESAILQAAGALSYTWGSTPDDPGLAGQTTATSPVVSPTVTTIYTLDGIDQNSCANQDQIMIVVKSIPSSDFSINDDSLCVGQSTLLTYNGFAIPGSLFNWSFDGGQTMGSGPGPIEIAWTTPGSKILSLQITQLGCTSPVTIDSVFIIKIPTADFMADQTSGCPPLKVQFMDLSQDVIPGAEYQWSLGNGQTSGAQHPWFEYTRSGVYTIQLIISNQYGCSDTLKKTAYINVFPVPDAQFTNHPDRVSMLDPTIKFYDHSMGNPVSWLWDFGDQTYSDLQNTIHTYSDTGTYTTTLYVVNALGCRDTVSSEVIVYPDNTIYVPTSFSPNGDNHNDLFMIYGTNIPGYHIDIFRRWGVKVYSSSSMTEGWDGSYQGKPAPPEVYVVRIKYKDALGGPHSHYGHVLLMK